MHLFTYQWFCNLVLICWNYSWSFDYRMEFSHIVRDMINWKYSFINYLRNIHISRKDMAIHLTHWSRVTHICVGNLTIIVSDNGLSPGRRQAINWTNVGILLIGPPGTNFSEMLLEIHTFSFQKIHLKMPSGKWRPFCLGLNVLSSNSTSFPYTTVHRAELVPGVFLAQLFTWKVN